MSSNRCASIRVAGSMPLLFACSAPFSRIFERFPKKRMKTGTEASYMESGFAVVLKKTDGAADVILLFSDPSPCAQRPPLRLFAHISIAKESSRPSERSERGPGSINVGVSGSPQLGLARVGAQVGNSRLECLAAKAARPG